MDIFVHQRTPGAFDLDSARLINDYTRATWVERFIDPSEFIVEAPLDSLIREEMPIGSLVSHIESDELCIVENHEIVIDQDSDITDHIVVSGRSFETFLENRIVGTNHVWPFDNAAVAPYAISGGYACTQARQVIADHIDAQVLIDDNDALPQTNVWLDPWVSLTYGVLAQPGETIFERNNVYDEAKKLLALDNLGMKTIRFRQGYYLNDGRDTPSRYEIEAPTICIYPGHDRTKLVTFSHTMGDIKNATYLYSDKLLKTSCYIFSRYFSVVTHFPGSGFDRRVMVLDATDIDQQYDAAPTGSTRTQIMTAMQTRGRAALAKQNAVAISNVELEDKDLTYIYRHDYNLGDYVSVHGDYQASTTRQVTEHVEIQDENGYSAYPTLSEPPVGGYYVPSQQFP